MPRSTRAMLRSRLISIWPDALGAAYERRRLPVRRRRLCPDLLRRILPPDLCRPQVAHGDLGRAAPGLPHHLRQARPRLASRRRQPCPQGMPRETLPALQPGILAAPRAPGARPLCRTAERCRSGLPCSAQRTAAAPHPRRRRKSTQRPAGSSFRPARRQRAAEGLGRIGPEGGQLPGPMGIGLGAADGDLEPLPHHGHHIAQRQTDQLGTAQRRAAQRRSRAVAARGRGRRAV